MRTKLDQNDAKAFEEGHAKLGQLLGYDAGNRNNTASPDPWWMANGSFCFIFEDHSDAKPENSLNDDKARQACTHPNWVRENLPVNKNATIVSILVTPASVADDAALPHLKGLLVWNLSDFRKWARTAISVVGKIGRQYPNSGDLVWRAAAAEKLAAANATPEMLLKMLSGNTVQKC